MRIHSGRWPSEHEHRRIPRQRSGDVEGKPVVEVLGAREENARPVIDELTEDGEGGGDRYVDVLGRAEEQGGDEHGSCLPRSTAPDIIW